MFHQQEMICVHQSEQFSPHGKIHLSMHPGPLEESNQDSSHGGLGYPLLKALQEISLTPAQQEEDWKVRQWPEQPDACEELYRHKNTAVWSRSDYRHFRKVVKSFTLMDPILDMHWCSFLLPLEDEHFLPQTGFQKESAGACTQTGVCLVQQSSVSVYTSEGQEYIAAMPFQISKSWPVQNGLMFERTLTEKLAPTRSAPATPLSVKPKPLPGLFSMLHPLDDIAPVICRLPGPTADNRVTFVNDPTQSIVFTSTAPSLAVTFNKRLSVHSIWFIRRTKKEEIVQVLQSADVTGLAGDQSTGVDHLGRTPGMSQSASGHFSKVLLTSNSPAPSVSPFHSYHSRLLSPVTFSRINSPSLSHITGNFSSQSPAGGSSFASNSQRSRLLHQGTPSPSHVHTRSPATPQGPAGMGMGYSRTPLSYSTLAEGSALMEAPEPIAPEVCLEHLYTESNSRNNSGGGKAAKVFLTKDFCEQQYLCLFIASRNQLRCIKFDETNDQSQLIFGSVTPIIAKDAVSLGAHRMMLVLDMFKNLVLYSGLTKINLVHLVDLPRFVSTQPTVEAQLGPRDSIESFQGEQDISGPITSSRPASALGMRLDDSLATAGLSPVPTELSGQADSREHSLLMLGTVGGADGDGAGTTVKGTPSNIGSLRDGTDGGGFTVVLDDGRMFRAVMPDMAGDAVVLKCLRALQVVLPHDAAMTVYIRWYATSHSAGSENGSSACHQFLRCLLALIGLEYLIDDDGDTEDSEGQPKRSRLSNTFPEGDYYKALMETAFHKYYSKQGYICTSGLVPGQPSQAEQESHQAEQQPGQAEQVLGPDYNAVLFSQIWNVVFTLHMIYQELWLNQYLRPQLEPLVFTLYQVTCELGLEFFSEYYARNWPQLMTMPSRAANQDLLRAVNRPPNFDPEPTCLMQWLSDILRGETRSPFPYLPQISNMSKHLIVMCVLILHKDMTPKDISWSKYLTNASPKRSSDCESELNKVFSEIPATNSVFEKVIAYAAKQNITELYQNSALLAPVLQEAIYECRPFPPSNWPAAAYKLIGRLDLAKQRQSGRHDLPSSTKQPANNDVHDADTAALTKNEDGMEFLDQEILRLRFSEDLRVNEVKRLLDSSTPIRIDVKQRPEVTDHAFIEEQERHLLALSMRTMALPVGRGLLTMCTHHPIPTEPLSIPKLCLTGRSVPRNTTIDFSHIEISANVAYWPQFHNGVAAGLCPASAQTLQSAWILYNRPGVGATERTEISNEHAGMLMGLGLNGHLQGLALLNVHDYLCLTHELTSVGLLLGIAAGKLGTMDVTTTKMLSIHVPALLPPTSTELDLPPSVQVAAVLGIGLVYQGTAHRHIAEVLLNEIGRPPGPEMENSVDRESYSLAAGLGLGLVMLGRGGATAAGLSDVPMTDQLYHFMVGGHRKPMTNTMRERYRCHSFQIKEGDMVNTNVTSPGSTLALGMMYHKTNNSAVAEWLWPPDSQYLLDFVRPDFLMLRTVAHSLVMWDDVLPSVDWLTSRIPDIVQRYAFQALQYQNDPDCEIDFETMSQAYCNILTGACFSLGLKFAGSANKAAFDTLFVVVKRVMQLMKKTVCCEQAGKSTVENCLIVVVLSLSMVMAGTGNLDVLRLCRYLYCRAGTYFIHITYGSHMAISMAIGLLFLGGGRYTLCSKPEAVAAMLCAFYPKFPVHSNDNRYHLQAFRHLYVLAAEPRLLLPRDVLSGEACYVPVEITLKACEAYGEQSYTTMAPALLPELHKVKQIKVLGPRYWPITFDLEKDLKLVQRMLTLGNSLFVQQRSGHVPYKQDPKGYHSSAASSLVKEVSLGSLITAEKATSMTSDPLIHALAKYYNDGPVNKDSTTGDEESMRHYVSTVLHECIAEEKLEALPVYMELEKVALRSGTEEHLTFHLSYLRLLQHLYDKLLEDSPDEKHLFLSQSCLTSINSKIASKCLRWLDRTRFSTAAGKALRQYFNSEPISASTEALALAAILVFHRVPYQAEMKQKGVGRDTTYPQLLLKFRGAGSPQTSLYGLSKLLQHLPRACPSP